MCKVIMVTPYEQGIFRGESETESIKHTLDEMANIPRKLREMLKENFTLYSSEVEEVTEAKDKTKKKEF